MHQPATAEPVLLLTDRRMLAHDNGPGHPECSERLERILDVLETRPPPSLAWREPAPAPRDAVTAVHDPRYVEFVESIRGRRMQLDADTGTSPGSVEAAFLAAGAAVDAVDAVLSGAVRRAFALVRPPGHHAEHNRAMGFCLFNNIAIAAEHALRQDGIDRVLIVDWDIHHGNGTQHAFERRSDVLYLSSHRWPFYPGTGRADETGRDAGAGFTINVPLPVGAGDEVVVPIYRRLLPALATWRPQLVLVSAGFDAHRRDPLGGLRMTTDGLAALCALVRDVAEETAEGRMALILEGGYDLDALAESVRACVVDLAGGGADVGGHEDVEAVERILAPVRRAHRGRWGIE